MGRALSNRAGAIDYATGVAHLLAHADHTCKERAEMGIFDGRHAPTFRYVFLGRIRRRGHFPSGSRLVEHLRSRAVFVSYLRTWRVSNK